MHQNFSLTIQGPLLLCYFLCLTRYIRDRANASIVENLWSQFLLHNSFHYWLFSFHIHSYRAFAIAGVHLSRCKRGDCPSCSEYSCIIAQKCRSQAVLVLKGESTLKNCFLSCFGNWTSHCKYLKTWLIFFLPNFHLFSVDTCKVNNCKKSPSLKFRSCTVNI